MKLSSISEELIPPEFQGCADKSSPVSWPGKLVQVWERSPTEEMWRDFCWIKKKNFFF